MVVVWLLKTFDCRSKRTLPSIPDALPSPTLGPWERLHMILLNLPGNEMGAKEHVIEWSCYELLKHLTQELNVSIGIAMRNLLNKCLKKYIYIEDPSFNSQLNGMLSK